MAGTNAAWPRQHVLNRCSLQKVGFDTSNGDGECRFWNRYVAVTQTGPRQPAIVVLAVRIADATRQRDDTVVCKHIAVEI